MAQNIKAAAAKGTPEDPVAPKKSSKKLLIGVIVSLVVVLGAGGGWYATKGKDGAKHVEEVKEVPPKPPIFVALEPFTVNLQREASDQYLQLGLTFKVFEAEFESKIKANLPEIRSKVLQLLTTKTATELLTAEGKKLLVKEILELSNPVIGVIDKPVRALAPAPQPAATDAHVPEAAHTPDPAATPSAEATPASETAAVAPVVVHKVVPVKTGIVDVLFTSFIIQ